MSDNQDALVELFHWIADVDPVEAQATVAGLRASKPTASSTELAQSIFERARWQAASSGVLTGLPANPLVAAPAALLDVGTVFRIEANAVARVALLFDPDFFGDERAQLEVLLPVFGFGVASQVAREVGVRAGMKLSRELLRTHLSRRTLAVAKRVCLKYLGVRISQRALVTKTVPIVGGLIGGAWNFGEVTLLRNRSIKYFSGDEL